MIQKPSLGNEAGTSCSILNLINILMSSEWKKVELSWQKWVHVHMECFLHLSIQIEFVVMLNLMLLVLIRCKLKRLPDASRQGQLGLVYSELSHRSNHLSQLS